MSAKSVHDLGTDVVRSVMEDLFQRFMNDEELFPFFSNMRLSFLKIHSLTILKSAYVGAHSKEDLIRIFKLHEHLFREQGLGIAHYNKMVNHLQGALAKNGVPNHIIDDSITSLTEFKDMFEKGAAYSYPVTPKKRSMYLKAPVTPTSGRDDSVSPNSFRNSFRERLTKSPSFMVRSIRLITKGAA